MTRLRLATGHTFRSLRSRNFRLFFTGQLVSQAGTWMQSVAIVWVVLDLTGSGLALGLVTALQFLPMLVLGAWAGAVSDRLDRHRIVIATQVAFTALAVVFSVLTLSGHMTVLLVYALAAVFGVITALDNPARRALVVELVDEDAVANAVGLNSALMTGSRVVGPALAGALIAGPGVAWCFVVNAVTYLAVIGGLVAMDRSAFRSPPRVAKAKGQIRAGLRYAWQTPDLRVPLVLVAAVGTLAFNYQVTLPLLAERTFAGTATTFTLLFAVMSAGSLAGALMVARRTAVDLRFLVRAGTGLTVGTAALTLAPSLPVALVAVLPVGYYSIFLISGANALVQMRAEPVMRGRVLALFAVVFLGTTPIGGPVVGWLSQVADPRAGLAIGGLAAGLATLWTARQAATARRAGAQPRAVEAVADEPTGPVPVAA